MSLCSLQPTINFISPSIIYCFECLFLQPPNTHMLTYPHLCRIWSMSWRSTILFARIEEQPRVRQWLFHKTSELEWKCWLLFDSGYSTSTTNSLVNLTIQVAFSIFIISRSWVWLIASTVLLFHRHSEIWQIWVIWICLMLALRFHASQSILSDTWEPKFSYTGSEPYTPYGTLSWWCNYIIAREWVVTDLIIFTVKSKSVEHVIV